MRSSHTSKNGVIQPSSDSQAELSCFSIPRRHGEWCHWSRCQQQQGHEESSPNGVTRSLQGINTAYSRRTRSSKLARLSMHVFHCANDVLIDCSRTGLLRVREMGFHTDTTVSFDTMSDTDKYLHDLSKCPSSSTGAICDYHSQN